MRDRITGYHFTGDTLRDGRPIPPLGEWCVAETADLCCYQHSYDALAFAPVVPSPTLHKVELEGDLTADDDPPTEWRGRRRRLLASIDATALLREYAHWSASHVLKLWSAPAVVRRYLKTRDEALRDTAKTTAWAAARSIGEGGAEAAAFAASCAASGASMAAADFATLAIRLSGGADWEAAQRARLAELVEAAFAEKGEQE